MEDTPKQNGNPSSEPERGPSPEPDLEQAVAAADPADKAQEIQERVEEEAKAGDEQALKQVNLQQALREGFSYLNMIGQQIAPPFEHQEAELDNLAVLWSEVLKDVPREKLMRFIERMPLVAAGAYTVVTTGPKIRDSIQYIQKKKNATLEQTDKSDPDHD